MGNNKLFIFGLGYSSLYIVRAAQEAGFSVMGTCRTQEKCDQLKEQGVEAYLFDYVPKEVISNANHILSSVPPQEHGDVVLPLLEKLDCFANARNDTSKWLGYLSTTGVYGDWGGEWVDEESELRGVGGRLQRRIKAEQDWLGLGGHVFRLAGIYGPGRNAIEEVKAGRARRIDRPGQVFSRIHVEDIAQVILASMKTPKPGSIYNVCDDEPAPAHEVVSYACELLGKKPPPLLPFTAANLSPMGKEFYSANRRVSNKRIKIELQVCLKYPTYQDGLRAIVDLA